MLGKLWRRPTSTRAVEFCETCGQVCTSECRAEAALERARTQAAYQLPIIR